MRCLRSRSLRALEFFSAPSAVHVQDGQCGVEDRERSRGSSILLRNANECECFLACRADFVEVHKPILFYFVRSHTGLFFGEQLQLQIAERFALRPL